MRALRADLRSVRGSRSLLIGFLHLPLSGGEPYRLPPAVGRGWVCLCLSCGPDSVPYRLSGGIVLEMSFVLAVRRRRTEA
ncbi:hypothetical protein GCM10010255_23750 [Streptomyces coeruleofuscus]|uniref:Uncharacterized protein n=1 Tax=Streptomyces coeruleofuscus TaxID=66879 RepID=A0ABP5V370_9ACTN